MQCSIPFRSATAAVAVPTKHITRPTLTNTRNSPPTAPSRSKSIPRECARLQPSNAPEAPVAAKTPASFVPTAISPAAVSPSPSPPSSPPAEVAFIHSSDAGCEGIPASLRRQINVLLMIASSLLWRLFVFVVSQAVLYIHVF